MGKKDSQSYLVGKTLVFWFLFGLEGVLAETPGLPATRKTRDRGCSLDGEWGRVLIRGKTLGQKTLG